MFGDQNEDDTAFEETVVDEAPLQPELFEQKELTEMVRRALKELPERYREVLLMRYEDNFSFDDIAYTLAAPVNTVKSWHRRGLIRLREFLTHPASNQHYDA